MARPCRAREALPTTAARRSHECGRRSVLAAVLPPPFAAISSARGQDERLYVPFDSTTTRSHPRRGRALTSWPPTPWSASSTARPRSPPTAARTTAGSTWTTPPRGDAPRNQGKARGPRLRAVSRLPSRGAAFLQAASPRARTRAPPLSSSCDCSTTTRQSPIAALAEGSSATPPASPRGYLLEKRRRSLKTQPSARRPFGRPDLAISPSSPITGDLHELSHPDDDEQDD